MNTKKNWKRAGKQRYLCKICWFVWEPWKWRKQTKPSKTELLENFVRDEVKYRQMTKLYNVTLPTIRRWMKNTNFDNHYCDKIKPEKIILLMDTTYFWRKYWYMIFRAWYPEKRKWKNLLWYKIKYETNDKYREGFKYLMNKWREIVGIVCDWRQWLLWWFWEIPTQMCIYHMKQIITRYLRKRPRLKENKELKNIGMCIWEYPKEDIEIALEIWRQTNNNWFNEKNEKWNYMHLKTRKAYRSMKRKLYRCYTFKRHRELWIPTTNNSLESINSHLKTKLWIHRWLKESNKDTFTNYYLYIS